MNYIAYTIGPIYETIFDTLNGDHKTKKLYAGSYFFSYFMKLLLKNIKEDFDILVPYIEGDVLTKEHRMGLFHDRFIAQSNKSKDEITKIFDEKVNQTFKTLAEEIQDTSISTVLMQNMDNHVVVFTENELKQIDENIIFALNKILDSKELNRRFSFDKEKNYIQKYQDDFIHRSKHKVKTLEMLCGDFDYYAVIAADGDKMGTKIKNEATADVNGIKQISRKLHTFFTDDKDMYEITNHEFGGELIYAGGDDILAFLPVKKDDKSFLEYIDTLDARFKEIVGDDVSLSFGVNIVYKKYPLRDAVQSAFELLYKAKSHGPNSVAMKMTKHSGQWFDSHFCLDDKRYASYKKLVEDVLQERVSLPHSLHHSLKRYEAAIISVFQNEDSSTAAMFKTVFNDANDQKTLSGLKDVQMYLDICQPSSNSDFDKIFSELSLIKFLREDRK